MRETVSVPVPRAVALTQNPAREDPFTGIVTLVTVAPYASTIVMPPEVETVNACAADTFLWVPSGARE